MLNFAKKHKIYTGFLVISFSAIALFHWRLHRYSAKDYFAPGSGPEVREQLNWIGAKLRSDGGEETQAWYPEGYFFAHALYGYALVNEALVNPDNIELRKRNIAEIQWVLRQLESEAGRRPFPRNQVVEHGVFYQGWKNRLIGGLLLLQSEAERDRVVVREFNRQSAALAAAFRASSTYHLEAYPGQAWPVDNIVALTSLKIHDFLFNTSYGEVVNEWLEYTRTNLTAETGLIPHYIDANTGQIRENSRGSALGLYLAFLPELDADFAKEQYKLYRDKYAQPVLDFPLIREYPNGTNGKADVDSGPLVFGLGPVATGVSLVAAKANGDAEIFERRMQLSETFGVPFTWGGKKRYGLGLIVVGDAFEVWGKTWVPWRVPTNHPGLVNYPRLTPQLHWWSYLITVAIAVLLLFPVFLSRKPPRRRR